MMLRSKPSSIYMVTTAVTSHSIRDIKNRAYILLSSPCRNAGVLLGLNASSLHDHAVCQPFQPAEYNTFEISHVQL